MAQTVKLTATKTCLHLSPYLQGVYICKHVYIL